ncbi:MAG: hypothetical protein JRE40_03715 [Deltaproteobacteria bacterium]|nr:hypothetical protein [Deltaproteobacteria bacterium]
MVDSINTSSVPSLPSPHTTIKSDSGYSSKTDDVKGDKLNNRATLSAPKTDSTESYEPFEENIVAQNDNAVHKASESAQNEPPGSKIDVLA